MFQRKYKIRTSRPIFFLCGPYYNSENVKDRRKIVLDYMNELEITDSERKPIPFIIDPLFGTDVLEKYNLKISLVEEIVACIAYKTYIFLDTYSTAAELGLFMNSSQKNQIKVLVPKYKSIGEFINLSSRTSNNLIDIIEYDYILESKCNQYYYNFIDNTIEESIKNDICNELYKYQKNQQDLDINFKKINEYPDTLNTINYFSSFDTLFLYVGLKTLFYIILSIQAIRPLRAFTSMNIDNDLLSKVNSELVDFLSNIFIANCSDEKLLAATMVLNRKKIRVKIQTINSIDTDELIYHILCIIQKMQESNIAESRSGPKVLALSDSRDVYRGYSFDRKPNFFDLFQLKVSDLKLIQSYRKTPSKYINHKQLIINGKRRKIVSYKDNKYGLMLRDLHKKINRQLDIFDISTHAFGYVKNKSIMTAINQHKESKVFLKLDIKSFFESISQNKLEKMIFCLVDEYKDECISRKFNIAFPQNTIRRQYSSKIDHTGLKEVLSACFYKRHLPLGFVTSPSLSNIYMIVIDNIMSKFNNFEYTRYADDIMISTKNEDLLIDLRITENKLEEALEAFSLKLNYMKRRRVVFRTNDDYIKYLGVNIVNQYPQNRFTISHKYIMETLQMENEINKKLQNKIRGRVQFIKNVSEDSYDKYLKIRKIKFNNN